MNLISMFADSIHFSELQDSIAGQEDEALETGQVLLETQCAVNAFVGQIGECLVTNMVADTYMMLGEPFSTEIVKYFSIAIILFNRDTKKRHSYVLPFKLVLDDTDVVILGDAVHESKGLYLDI